MRFEGEKVARGGIENLSWWWFRRYVGGRWGFRIGLLGTKTVGTGRAAKQEADRVVLGGWRRRVEFAEIRLLGQSELNRDWAWGGVGR